MENCTSNGTLSLESRLWMVEAVVVHNIPKGTTQVIFRGKVSKTTHAIVLALCQKGIQVMLIGLQTRKIVIETYDSSDFYFVCLQVVTLDAYEHLKLRENDKLANANLVHSKKCNQKVKLKRLSFAHVFNNIFFGYHFCFTILDLHSI